MCAFFCYFGDNFISSFGDNFILSFGETYIISLCQIIISSLKTDSTLKTIWFCPYGLHFHTYTYVLWSGSMRITLEKRCYFSHLFLSLASEILKFLNQAKVVCLLIMTRLSRKRIIEIMVLITYLFLFATSSFRWPVMVKASGIDL